ncbi:LOW QUALITY PROTEIN: hypothetical protein M513_09514, partial [Trichuris suis]
QDISTYKAEILFLVVPNLTPLRQHDSILQEIFNDEYLCLEHTALSWTPFIFLILSSLFLCREAMRKKRNPLPKTYLLLSRLAISFLLVIASITTCCLIPSVQATGVPINSIDELAYSLNALAMIFLFLLTVLCSRRGIITSGSLFLSNTFYCVFESMEFSATVRRFNYGKWSSLDVSYAVYYCLLLMQLIISCWADRMDVWDIPAKGKETNEENPEKTVSFFNRITYAFFDPIAWRGWRRGVQKEDLWLLLPKDTVEELRQKWENLWNAKSQRFLNAQRHRQPSISYDNKKVSISLEAAVHKAKREAPSVFLTLVQCFKWQALTSVFIRTLSDIFEFMKPLILRNLIQYMAIKELTLSYGIFFSFMLLLIGIFQSLLLQTYHITMTRVGMNLKSILISAIFEKALRLSNESRKQTTAGEMINMMSADIERVLHVCPYLLLVWSAPLEVILALVFLWGNLGPSVFAGLGVMVLMIPINFAISNLELKCQESNSIYGDQRTYFKLWHFLFIHAAANWHFSIAITYHITMTRVGMNLKSILISAIFEKALRLSNESRKQTTAGEMINMMSADIERVLHVCPYLLLVWSAPLEVILALVFLWGNLGPSVFAGLGVMVLMIPINFAISNLELKCQVQQMALKDTRMKMMNEVLNGIKALKLHAWEPAFEKKLADIRKQELHMLRKAAIYRSVITFAWIVTPPLIAVVSFATFLLSDPSNELTPEVTFVSLSLFHILHMPISLIPIVVAYAIHAYVSLKRLSTFLRLEELDESTVLRTEGSHSAISFEKATFSWEADSESSAILRNLNLKVPRGACIAVIGRVGSGKSSFCSAILGEMYKVNGSITVSGSVAYVPQQAWILNATVKNNVLFYSPERPEFYKKVVHACSLDVDIKEMPKGDQTEIGEKGSVAYVPQQAWILNATVKNNVLFYSPERPEFYKKVVHACSLDVDIKEMPKGDQTEIGEKGSNLSGGQKQRLSLARAVYQDANIYLLDDPLSAVDSHVGRHIFDHVIGKNGLLRKKTRIFVTNAVTYLKEVDIIVILEDGGIKTIGTPSELLKEEDVLKQFLKEEINPDYERAAEQGGRKSYEEISQLDVKRLHGKSSISSIISLAETSRRSSRATVEPYVNEVMASQDKSAVLTEEETMESGRVAWRVYRIYMRSIGAFNCLTVLLVYIISAALTIASSDWLARWSEDALLSKNDSRYVNTDTRIGGYAGFSIGQAFFMFLGALLLAFGMVRASAKLHANLLHSLFRVPMDFYETTPVGRILNRVGKDIDMVDNLLATNIRELLNTVTQVIRTLVIVMINMSVFGVVVIPLAALYVCLQRFYVATSRQLQRMEAVSRSPIYSLFQEVVQGISSVRAYNAQQWFRKRFDMLINENQMNYFPKIISNRWLAVRIEFISTIMVFCAAMFAVCSRDSGIMSAGMIGLSITYALTITQVLNWVMEIASFVETNIVSVERIDEYIQLKHEKCEAWNEGDILLLWKQFIEYTVFAPWKTDFQPPADWPSKGQVTFEKYSTRYRPGLDLALKDISFVIHEHEKAGIVGRTGAGKSSVTLALFRIVEPAEGAIYIDSIKTSDLGLHDLRSRISKESLQTENMLMSTLQDPVLFFGTIRMNIDPPEQKTDDEIWLALEQANLKPFVSNLPGKLDFEVSEGGENLSVGQRQMLCLARALLRRSRILVLDEATAAVDLETDQLIQDTIRRYFADCTVLTIAHRLNTILDSDRILVLSNGYLIENNSPENLLKDNESEFYSMARESNIV